MQTAPTPGVSELHPLLFCPISLVSSMRRNRELTCSFFQSQMQVSRLLGVLPKRSGPGGPEETVGAWSW